MRSSVDGIHFRNCWIRGCLANCSARTADGNAGSEYAQVAAAFRKGLGEIGLLIVVLALVKPLSPPGDLSGQLICGPIEA